MKFIKKPAKKFEEGYCFLGCDVDCHPYCNVVGCDLCVRYW
ncbi:MAG: Clo7bot family Cys-rich peptide [Paraclostridium bifermentans]|nr:Clo7bot family Cys-rich peptide [Paraclostridium bifermentans]MBS5953792.1 Clo7bot family Cys-rich peptide [Paraclostridium bifermentans]